MSHNLERVFRIAERIVVLQNRRTIASAVTKDTTHEEVSGWITGIGTRAATPAGQAS